jgi:hypothetical protein
VSDQETRGCGGTFLGLVAVRRERESTERARQLVSTLIHVMSSSSLGSTAFVIFAVLSVVTLKELNVQVPEPYMVCFPLSVTT